MNRKTWINVHLFTAAFLTPFLILVAVSGGLYLLGYKGEVVRSPVALPNGASLDVSSDRLEKDVREVLEAVDTTYSFEYVKLSGSQMFTRPTSSAHYQFDMTTGELTATFNEPSLQKRLIELHKGHGPLAFKTFQKGAALGLIVVVISGFWLGITSPALSKYTWMVAGSGLLLSVALVFL